MQLGLLQKRQREAVTWAAEVNTVLQQRNWHLRGCLTELEMLGLSAGRDEARSQLGLRGMMGLLIEEAGMTEPFLAQGLERGMVDLLAEASRTAQLSATEIQVEMQDAFVEWTM